MLIPAKIDSLNDLDKFNELKKHKYIVKICFSFILFNTVVGRFLYRYRGAHGSRVSLYHNAVIQHTKKHKY